MPKVKEPVSIPLSPISEKKQLILPSPSLKPVNKSYLTDMKQNFCQETYDLKNMEHNVSYNIGSSYSNANYKRRYDRNQSKFGQTNLTI